MSPRSSASQAPTSQASFSEIEICAHWSMCPKTAYNRRNAGNMPPHFVEGKQRKIRYLVSDIEAFEQAQQLKTKKKTEPQK
ncbi:MAG: helix-turn-helix domain-containing protein [Methylococcaceae bacterium]